tara:strand:- start:834 stop:2393 length:1560 start_codon:yes stop_codon:yes gene_type:complete
MWLIIVAVISLILFFNYFLKIKIDWNNKIKLKKSKSRLLTQKEKEDIPASVSLAYYEQNRALFLVFSKFFLLVKRPYGIKYDLDNITNEKGEITGIKQGGQQTMNKTGCNRVCSEDPKCNAWQYDGDHCQKYNVSKVEDIKRYQKGETEKQDDIGYIFRPDDSSWVVSDLSGLSTNKDVFKAVADMVLRFQPKDSGLRSRASTVAASVSVKYCYEKEVTSDVPSDEYLTQRQEALTALENAAKFFIFTGDSGEYPNKTELSLYFALLVDVMLKDLYIDNPHLKSAIKSAIGTLKKYYIDYILLRNYFDNSLDKNRNGKASRDEIAQLYREAIETGKENLLNNEIFQQELVIDASGVCLNNNRIMNLVELFFTEYDSNRDGFVTLQEILSSDYIPKPSYEAVCAAQLEGSNVTMEDMYKRSLRRIKKSALNNEEKRRWFENEVDRQAHLYAKYNNLSDKHQNLKKDIIAATDYLNELKENLADPNDISNATLVLNELLKQEKELASKLSNLSIIIHPFES